MHRFHDQSTAGKLSRRNLFRLGAGGALAASVSACASPDRGPAVPLGRTKEASVLGLPNERFFPATGAGPLEQEFNQAVMRLTARRGLNSPLDLPQLQLLAISGGGENGAFGAGLLCGWTEQGTRPEFELVTGISTGALTAPFAYLGPAYDAQLRSVYTELEPKQVLISRFVTAAVWDDAMADNSPLFHTISRYLDDRMLADIAKAYDSGRLLLIASTDLDAQQPVIWNIGAIAKSGHPKAANTIRRVLLASAAIPGAFPPTMFEVTLDGKAYQEMHVDGGAFAQTFLYPPSLTASRRKRMQAKLPVLKLDAFIIRNGRLDAEWATVERRTLGIASRAISTMITSAGYNDVVKIYYATLSKLQRTRLSSKGTPPAVRVLRSREWLHVWFCEAEKPRKLTGMLRVELALDAMRHGQDLVADLVDRSLKEAERRSTDTPAAHI